MSGCSVLLVDPRRAIREATAESLTHDHDLRVLATADDKGAALLQARRVEPDVVVVSTSYEGDLAALCAELHALEPPPRVLLADRTQDEEALFHAIEVGFDGYTSGIHGMQGLARAIEAIARGESVVPSALLGSLLRRLIERQRQAAGAAERLVSLTRREREVLSMMVDGADQAGIATQLYISPETVRTHMQRILRKLDVHSRAEAVSLVARTGLADRLERIVERSAS